MSNYKIEKNIPVPDRGRRARYPFSQMEVGDSVLIADIDRSSQLASYWQHLRPKRFVSRKVDGGIRVWRLE